MKNQLTELAGDSGGRYSWRNGSPLTSIPEPCHPGQATFDDVDSPSPCKMKDAASKPQRASVGARFMAAVTVVLLGSLLTATVEGQGDGLFSEVEPAALRTRRRPSASTDATTLRRRVVTMDLGRLQRARAAALSRQPVRTKAVSPGSGDRDAVPTPGATLTLNLFEDVVVTGIVERTEPTYSGGYSISGRLGGNSPGTLTIVVNGETVAGTVRTPGGTYRIRSVGGGRYTISEVKEPPLDCEVLEPESD